MRIGLTTKQQDEILRRHNKFRQLVKDGKVHNNLSEVLPPADPSSIMPLVMEKFQNKILKTYNCFQIIQIRFSSNFSSISRFGTKNWQPLLKDGLLNAFSNTIAADTLAQWVRTTKFQTFYCLKVIIFSEKISSSFFFKCGVLFWVQYL